MNKICSLFLLFFLVSISPFLKAQSLKFNSDHLAEELRESLINNILTVWYPRTLDIENGGFLSDFDSEWRPTERQVKMLVSQARHLWTASKVAVFLEDSNYRKIADHAFKFLKNKMYDKKYGGFYLIRDKTGNRISESVNNKSSYSISFAIYSLSAYYALTKDSTALNLAKETFYWLDKMAHDNKHGGYFDLLNREGELQNVERIKTGHSYHVQSNWKDQNSSIHILEAFTELYSVWPNELLKDRLSEMLTIVRDTIIGDKEYLTLYLTEEWNPITFKDSSDALREANHHLDHVSFGHDVETAFLMLEASDVLGLEKDIKTLRIAKNVVDHSLNHGWDKKNGGFFYEGYYYQGKKIPHIIDSSKVWWVQAEGLNSLLLMSKLFPEEKQYFNAFRSQWKYIKEFMIDKKNGGWFEEGLDISPEFIDSPKAHMWKINYHNVRALMNCIKLLEEINNH